MKRIILILSLALCRIGMNVQAAIFQDGDTIWATMQRENAIIGAHEEIASPNVYYKNGYRASCTSFGVVHVHGDTLIIRYYANTPDMDTSISNLEKEEVFDAKAYFASGADLVVNGKQSYYENGHLYCEENVRNNRFATTTWFTSSGEKERVYVFAGNKLIQMLQLYPSGKVMWKEDYISGQKEPQAWTEDSQEAVKQAPSFPGGLRAFEDYFNRFFLCSRSYDYGKFTAAVTVHPDGQCEIRLYDLDDQRSIYFSSDRIPAWHPVTINGKPVRYTLICKLTYLPLFCLHDGDTVNVDTGERTTYTRSGKTWRDTHMFCPNSADTCHYYGICSHRKDTIILDCYSREDNRLVARIGTTFAPEPIELLTDTPNIQAPLDMLALANAMLRQANKHLSTKISSPRTVFTEQYADGRKTYEEHYKGEHPAIITWFNEKGGFKYIYVTRVIKRKGKSDWLEYRLVREFYPDGHTVKVAENYPEKGKPEITYYTPDGRKTDNYILPTYPKDAKALEKYLQKNLQPHKTNFGKYNWKDIRGFFELHVEIDENGNVLNMAIGTASMGYSKDARRRDLTRAEKQEFYDLAIECLKRNNSLWNPGTIEGVPTTLRTYYTINFQFTNPQ